MNFRSRIVSFLTGFVLFIILLKCTSRRHSQHSHRKSDGWVQPNYYRFRDPVELIVNKVESDFTQLPFAYYDLPFTCPPTNLKKPLHLSLNEIIRGDRKWQSDYQLSFKVDDPCHTLCSRKTTASGMKKAKKLVEQGYVAQWLIDDELPAATTFISTIDQKKYYASGFPLGYVDQETGKVFLNNHLMLVIRYNTVDSEWSTIVGFEVYPRSVADFHCPGASKDCEHFEIVVPEDGGDVYIPMTYSVYWREEYNVNWENRWNFFLNSGELSEDSSKKFHWMSLANSVGILLLISFIVVLNLLRILKKDTKDVSLAEVALDNEDNNDSIYITARDWLLETDKSIWLDSLTVVVSMGIQVFHTILGSLTISCSLNKLHNIRKSVLTFALLCFISGGFMASATGTWLNLIHQEFYPSNDMKNKTSNYNALFAVLCGSSLPGLVMLITLVLNCVIWAKDSTHALPFGTIFYLIAIYFIVCIPLSYLGGTITMKIYQSNRIFSFLKINNTKLEPLLRQKKPSAYKAVSELRLKPLKDWLKFYSVAILISGFFPFIVIYVELQFVYKSVWLEKTTFYYFYGFLLANIILLCILICEISLLGCFVLMRLNTITKKSLNTNWRWNCFLIGTSCAWYMELYTLYYIFFTLRTCGFSSIFISVCYSAVFNIMCGCAMGSLGYLTSAWFVNNIYSLKYTKA